MTWKPVLPTLFDEKPPPGQFRARCGLMRWKPDKKLTPEERREASEKSYPRKFNRDAEGGKGRIEVGFPECEGFETDDRGVFEAHMRDVHGRTSKKRAIWSTYPSQLPPSVFPLWKPPRLLEEGKPWEDKQSLTRTCETCGLVAEVAGRDFDRWWYEHQEAHAAEAGAA